MSIKTIMATAERSILAGNGQSLMAALSAWIRDSADRARQRRALARLSDFDLRDIGLTRRDVADETGKPFWRI